MNPALNNKDVEPQAYLDKAQEDLQAAEVCVNSGLLNNAARCAYFAVYHAAIAALLVAGIRVKDWDHDKVQANFNGVLIGKRHLYGQDLTGVLNDLMRLRLMADYTAESVAKKAAERALRAAQRFIVAVEGR